MAQLRHDYDKFTALNTEIILIVPNGPFMINRYLKKHSTPYRILTDKGSQVAGQYAQVKQFFALGTPTVFLVDQNGKIAYAYYAKSVLEEPANEAPLAVLTTLAP